MSQKAKPGSASSKKVVREKSAPLLRKAVLRRLPQRLSATAQYRVPPAPGLLEHYVQLFNDVWLGIGRVFSEDDLEQFRVALRTNLQEAWTASPYSRVLVTFETDAPPKTSLSWRINVEALTIADEYEHWVKTRTPPLFGKHPDAKIFELARSLGAPAEVPILDIGAGTGRNTLPLARAGYPTDAVELAPALAAILREDAAKEGLSVRVLEANLFEPGLGVEPGQYRILLLAEVVASHFRTWGELRGLFQIAAKLLPTGGVLVFSAFRAVMATSPMTSRERCRKSCGVTSSLGASCKTLWQTNRCSSCRTSPCWHSKRRTCRPTNGRRPVGSKLGPADRIYSISQLASHQWSCAGSSTESAEERGGLVRAKQPG